MQEKIGLVFKSSAWVLGVSIYESLELLLISPYLPNDKKKNRGMIAGFIEPEDRFSPAFLLCDRGVFRGVRCR
jgi:hypothetical protein